MSIEASKEIASPDTGSSVPDALTSEGSSLKIPPYSRTLSSSGRKRFDAAIFRESLEAISKRDGTDLAEVDKYFLKGFLSYANRLYSTGEISESAYISIVTQAAESYVEQLVESKIFNALGKYEAYLNAHGEFWL